MSKSRTKVKWLVTVTAVCVIIIVILALAGTEALRSPLAVLPSSDVNTEPSKNAAFWKVAGSIEPSMSPMQPGTSAPNRWTQSAVLDQTIRSALDAQNAESAVAGLALVADDLHAHNHLRLIGATCVKAQRSSALSSPIDAESVNGQLRVKLADFLKRYCGDVTALNRKIEAITARNPVGTYSEREEYINALFALPNSEFKAKSLINEILHSPDIRTSNYQAENLSSLAKEGAPLAKWQKYLRQYPSEEETRAAFEIAGELLNCPRLGGCGENQFHLTYECALARNCRPGEDLLAYRRRTTSPELFQAAEQIEAEMQAMQRSKAQ